jgi:alkylhydroperoxidase family enzyme
VDIIIVSIRGLDVQNTAPPLNLPPLIRCQITSPSISASDDKLGFMPNVLAAYAFDTAKFDAFSAMYNDVMLADSGLSKLEREMIAVVVCRP